MSDTLTETLLSTEQLGAITPPKLVPVEALCLGVVDILKTRLINSVTVQYFPDKPAEFDFEGYDAAALVLYLGSQFDRQGLRGAQGIHQQIRLRVTLLVRLLHGHGGALGLLHDIRRSLQGVSVAGCTALVPTNEALNSEQQNVFSYDVDFETTLIAVPQDHARATGVLVPRNIQSNPRS
jgi:hypothetical protein